MGIDDTDARKLSSALRTLREYSEQIAGAGCEGAALRAVRTAISVLVDGPGATS
jgi:hypothetical protein